MATMYYRPYTSEPITDGDLPSDNAVESVLPELNYIFPAPATHRPAPRRAVAGAGGVGSVGQLPLVATDQAEQLTKYKEALRHMGQDILSLRDRIRELERENAGLQRDLTVHTDAAYMLQDAGDLDGVSKSELISRYASMKNSLVSASSELSQYKEKLQQLQQRAERHQNHRSGLKQLTEAHAAQQPLVQQLQAKAAKVKKLEAACEKQRQVMDRMQRLLAATRPQEAATGETLAKALAEENRRLREEIALLRDGQQQRQQQRSPGVDEGERLELYQLLDRAETRIAALERQLQDKARKWAADRDSLQDRLRSLRAKKHPK